MESLVNKQTLGRELSQAVYKAECSLTEVDRHCIQWHFEAEKKAVEGQSKTEATPDKRLRTVKGKGIDPCNWGSIRMTTDEWNIDMQQAALDKYCEKWNLACEKHDKLLKNNNIDWWKKNTLHIEKYPYGLRTEIGSRKMKYGNQNEDGDNNGNPIANIIAKVIGSKKCKPKKSKTRVIELVQQIALLSCLGRALGQVEKQAHPSSDSSDSLSSLSRSETSPSDNTASSSNSSIEESLDSDTSTESTTTSSSVEHCHHHHKHCKVKHKECQRKWKHSWSKSKKRSKKKWSGYGTLKPIPPNKYDGLLDLRTYHRFLTKGATYIEAGRVTPEKQVFVLSHYLTGKAHEFCICEVLGDLYRWNLHNFFLELFNSCFPVDFQTKQSWKLSKSLKCGHTIQEYVSELYELWNLIGDVSKHEKVMKLWSSCQHWL